MNGVIFVFYNFVLLIMMIDHFYDPIFDLESIACRQQYPEFFLWFAGFLGLALDFPLPFLLSPTLALSFHRDGYFR